MPFAKAVFAAAFTGAFLCAGPQAGPVSGARQAPPPRPTLLVFITVDQLRPDYLETWRGQFTGGLKRLLDGGAVFTDAHHDHAITETAPGHATVMSGRFPRSTGITRNIAGVNAAEYPLLGATGSGAAPNRFRGTTLTDWLLRANSRTRALSVSAKDRGAILPIGRSKQEVYWYHGSGIFTTSSWYRDSLPEWVRAFNNLRTPARSAGRVWTPLLADSAYPEPDSVPAEANGRGFMFPHVISDDSTRAAAGFYGTPWMDSLTAAFALEGLRQLDLGRGPGTDILAISLSASDAVGHRYGPDSKELHDQVLRLDRTIGWLLDSVFTLRDSSRVIVALTADHGVQPFPELSQSRFTPPPQRVDVGPAVAAARSLITAAGGDPEAVDLESGALIIDPAAVRVPRATVDSAADAFVVAARAIPGVLMAERYAALKRRNLERDPLARRWVHMFPADVPAEAVVTLTEGSYWARYPVALHGTPHRLDTHVPVIFYGPAFRPGRYDGFVRTVDIAPTLARALGVSPTERLDGRPLTAALR